MWLNISDFELEGSILMRKTKIIDSWNTWKIVWISWWVHWDEHYWVQVNHDFLSRLEKWELELRSWKISLILAWNEEALLQSKRGVLKWNPHDLNRVVDRSTIPETERINSYTQNRGAEIKELIDTTEPESWLDLHSFSAEKWRPYAFSSLHGFNNIWKDIGIQNMAVNMGNANKSANAWKRLWSGVSDYVNFCWANGFTFEAGFHRDPNCFIATYQALINFLVAHDMMEPKMIHIKWDNIIFNDHNDIVPVWWEVSSHVHLEYRHNFVWEIDNQTGERKWGFEYAWEAPESFTAYKSWDVIWYDIYPNRRKVEVKAQFDGYIILPKNPDVCTHGNEVFYFWKDMSEV